VFDHAEERAHAKFHDSNAIWSGNPWGDDPSGTSSIVRPEGLCPREYPGAASQAATFADVCD
jgi:hypothetical protein